MSSRLDTLSPELLLQIIEYLSKNDKVQLSSANSTLRGILLPELFGTLRLKNDETVASVAGMVAAKYGNHVRKLHFKGKARTADDRIDDSTGKRRWKGAPVLPGIIEELLRGKSLPNCTELELEFDFALIEEYWFAVFADLEQDENLGEEEMYARALMAATWRALSANQTIRKLVIKGLIPKLVSAFCTDEFKGFLSRLDELDLHTIGMDNGIGYKTNTLAGFNQFHGRLDNLIFDHLDRVETFRLTANKHSPLGFGGPLHVPLPLHTAHMPRLRVLQLKVVCINLELAEFLQAHAGSLKSLTLLDCMATIAVPELGISWSGFFDRILDAEPHMTRLVVQNSPIGLTHRERFGEKVPLEKEPVDVQRVRMALAEDGSRRLFSYGRMVNPTGSWLVDEKAVIQAFLHGEDQASYDKLMRRVGRNGGGMSYIN